MDLEVVPQLIILGGPNGAGKSTSAPVLLRDAYRVMEYVEADTIALGLSQFKAETVSFEAGRIMLKRLHDLIRRRISFAFESTLASRSYAPWIRRACEQGYGFHLVFLWLSSPEIAIQRVRERVQLGGHNVPEAVIRRRYYRGLRNFHELYQPLATSWAVYNNDRYPRLIAKRTTSADPLVHEPEPWRRFCQTDAGKS